MASLLGRYGCEDEAAQAHLTRHHDGRDCGRSNRMLRRIGTEPSRVQDEGDGRLQGGAPIRGEAGRLPPGMYAR
jgi:hypothetical protein